MNTLILIYSRTRVGKSRAKITTTSVLLPVAPCVDRGKAIDRICADGLLWWSPCRVLALKGCWRRVCICARVISLGLMFDIDGLPLVRNIQLSTAVTHAWTVVAVNYTELKRM